MGKVTYDISMSLDGFVTAANVRPEAGLGDGGEVLHEWAFDSASDPRNREFIEKAGDTGAIITGRTTYDLSIQYWGADGPVGSARVPTIIVSHTVPENIPANSVYSFVNDIAKAHELAQKLAGDKAIGISGASVPQQLIRAGFVDEISIHVVPVLFGSGTKMYEHIGGEHIKLEILEVIETKQVVHLRYRLVK